MGKSTELIRKTPYVRQHDVMCLTEFPSSPYLYCTCRNLSSALWPPLLYAARLPQVCMSRCSGPPWRMTAGYVIFREHHFWGHRNMWPSSTETSLLLLKRPIARNSGTWCADVDAIFNETWPQGLRWTSNWPWSRDPVNVHSCSQCCGKHGGSQGHGRLIPPPLPGRVRSV